MFRHLRKINIAIQLTLIVVLFAGLAIYIASRAAKAESQAVLLERHNVSLAEDSQSYRYALREAVRNLAREMRKTTQEHLPTLRARKNTVTIPDSFFERIDTEGLYRKVPLAAYLVEYRNREGKIIGRSAPNNLPDDAMTNLGNNLKKIEQLGGKHGYSLHKDDTGPRTRYLLAIACLLPFEDRDTPTRAVIGTYDFTQLIANQAHRMPRHLLFVQDTNGEFVYHPIATDIGTKNAPWSKPKDTATNGLLFKDRELSDYAYLSQRQPLPTTFVKEKEAGSELASKLLSINGLRFSYKSDQALLILSSEGEDPTVFQEARAAAITVQQSYTKSENLPTAQLPVLCKTFSGYLESFNLDDEGNTPLNVVLANSKEEVTASAALGEQWLKLFLPLLIGSAALPLVAAYFLTQPLRRLTKASQRLAQGDYSVDVKVSAPGEVGELATAFHEMVTYIRLRERELREKVARLNTILINAADGIITFDQAGRIEQANAAAEEMFGARPGGLVGTKVNKLMKLPEHLKQGVPAMLSSAGSSGQPLGGTMTQLMRAVKTPGVEHRGLRADGSTFWMEVTFSQVPLEDQQITTGIFRDVTRRKLDEQRIRQNNEELDARVHLRTAQLEDAKSKLELALEQAESAAAAKDRFISVVSHELRTPLTSAMGYTELLLNPRATKLRENPGPTLEKILTSCKHLLTLINDLLDVGRYTAGKPIDLAPTKFDLATFLKGVQEMVAPLVKRNGNVLETIVPPNLGEITNDETRLRQVLLNLLSNGSKFTEKGRVSLQVERRATDEGDKVVFRVSDTGAGMTPEQVEKLFTPFYRVDNSMTRRAGGTGLGLTITKMICELMGGEIKVESVANQGSTFTVTLPASISQIARKDSAHGDAAKGADDKPIKGTVLVIDDDATIRHMLETYLQQEGYRVVLAASGKEGLKLAREYQPTSITLDVLMPGDDGWDVLSRLKNDPATRDIPVVMLTIMEERNRGFALGATEYVTKPIDWGRLGAILCRHQPTGRDGQPILIVEDDALQRGYLREELILAGWTVLEANNGQEALKVCENTTPSLILLDLTMPIMDGFEFLDELRRRERGADIPVVVLTARELTEEDRRRLNRSVAQVLAKESLSKDALLERIGTQMSAMSARPEKASAL